jgi:lysophospholipase L1-like esterase
MKSYILFLYFIPMAISIASQPVTILPGDERIHVEGLNYTVPIQEKLILQRFRPDILQIPSHKLGVNPDKARNPSGGIIAFSTDSPSWTARFHVSNSNYMGTGFGIFENGQHVEEFKFNPKTESIELNVNSNSMGASNYEIALPSYSTIEFLGLELDPNHDLKEQCQADRPVYVALGDSISHGVGQDGFGHKTWPFLLSRRLDMELFNLAVGGGKISIPVAQMLEDWSKIKLVTILVGYNGLHFNRKSPDQYRRDYDQLLDTIRKNHPITTIVCISLLYTKKPVSEKTGHTADDFRDALESLIRERQLTDPNLIFIPGEEISSEKNLRADNPQDPVHLGIEGAAMLAEEVYEILQ